MWFEKTATDWYVNGDNWFEQGAGLLLGMLGSGAEGAFDGGTMALDAATFGAIDPLHKHVEKLKCDNGWEYTYAYYSLLVAREAAIAVLTGGGNVVVQTIGKGLAIYQVAHGSYSVGRGIRALGEEGLEDYGRDLIIQGTIETAGGFLIGWTSSRPAGGLAREAENAAGRARPQPQLPPGRSSPRIPRTPEPHVTVDPITGQPVGRFIATPKGPAMIEPVGGRTVSAGKGGVDTHTLYPNGSNYQRLNPVGHPNNPTPHGHGHLPGTGPGMRGQGPSLDPSGNVVPRNSPDAHWAYP